MNTFQKTALLSMVFVLLLITDVQFTPTLKVGWFPEAHAVFGVRRRAVRRTAIVVHSADAANYAAQQSATASQQQAAAATPAPAPAPAPAGSPPPADTSAALPMGTVVQSLPDGCTSKPSVGVDYYRCV